ncbi:hypothetical protein FH966_02500 [Lentibacillus cibarius]|uniref:Uncharacterized protein n=1 Tax=Lentibacillus cibarius TaxID=2583219 RepID=A0A549YFQ4_9BACI|nr:hypothetical protein [Lentibacillus cibarius]TRM10678.1 hypothetical protein FH966_02500 [Lentibacillus cibarius]
MTVNEALKPIYDKRVNYVVKSLAVGSTREELSDELNYSDYRSLDIYMRRRNFTWDSEKQNYVPAMEKKGQSIVQTTNHGKAGKVVKYFEEGLDPKQVAKNVGFKDHKKLAEYMKGKGYEWNSEQQNYTKIFGMIDKPEDGYKEAVPSPKQSVTNEANDGIQNGHSLEVLDLLENYKDRLMEVLNVTNNVNQIPRYAVPGTCMNKCAHISDAINELLLEFSREKNIKQRSIFETALIEFLKKYGYESEVKSKLNC